MPKFRDGRIERDVLNALRQSGLTMDQTLDALNTMRQAGIIFGKLYMNDGSEDCE